MAQERIDIVVSERGTRVVQRNIEDIGRSADRSARSVDFLRDALALVGGAALGREILRQIDLYTQLQNRLRSTGLAGRELGAVYDELLGVSNSTRSSLEGSIELYARLAISSKELGASQRELINFTQSLNQAILLSGASTAEAQAGLIQLSQGMASGTLRGDELRSVLEQLPAVADVIAGELGVTRGELRKMGEEGQITAQTILTAFRNARQELGERFGNTVPTISQSVQVLKNEIIDLAGELDSTLGIGERISRLLLEISENLDTIAKVLVSVTAGFLLLGTVVLNVKALGAALGALTAFILANPIGFLVVAITSAITAIALFGDEIKVGNDELTTMADLVAALAETLRATFGSVLREAQAGFTALRIILSELVGEIDISVASVLMSAARMIDFHLGQWAGAYEAIVTIFRQLPAVVGDYMVQGLNSALGVFGVEVENSNAGAAERYGTNIREAFLRGFNGTTTAQDFVQGLLNRASELASLRAATPPALEPPVDLGGDAGPGVSGMTPEARKKLIEDLEKLTGSLDRVWEAQRKYEEGVRILNQAEAEGLITETRRADLIALMGEQMRDALDPLAAINRELDEELRLLQLAERPREIENQLRATQADLLAAGVRLTAEEVALLRERLELIQRETEGAAARNAVYQATIGQQQEFIAQLGAVNELIASGALSRAEANDFLLQQNSDLLAGTIEAQQAWVAQYRQTYAQIDQLRQADLISEQTAAQLKARADNEILTQRLANTQSFFGNLAALSRTGNRELAAIGKAAAVTQATIDGVLAIQKALASAPPPANYALAASVGAATAANVATILSSTPGFAFGGDFTVGGSGPTDSQLVAFRATPGEKVSVRTPTQLSAGDKSGGNGGGLSIMIDARDPGAEGRIRTMIEEEMVPMILEAATSRTMSQMRRRRFT